MEIPIGLLRGPEAVSPTAHYTGHVWTRNALSHQALATLEGRALFGALEPVMMLYRALGGVTVEEMLLARHRAIDGLLSSAIEAGAVSQVLEVACGMSPRGWRFAERYGESLTYIEGDLPAMAARKRSALERIGSLSSAHRVVELDALATEGPRSLGAAAASLNRGRGLAVLTEGLLGYLPLPQVLDFWRRLAALLGEFAGNLYISDLHVGTDVEGVQARAFRLVLAAFVRGRVYVHFDTREEAEAALLEAGFSEASVLPAGRRASGAGAGGERVHVVEAKAS